MTDFLKSWSETFRREFLKNRAPNFLLWLTNIADKKISRLEKITALAFCIGLNLTLPQAQELLGTLGYELSDDSLVDRIVSQCLECGNYDVFDIDNKILAETGKSPFVKI